MQSPTQANRDALAAAAKAVIPSASPLAKSLEAEKQKEAERIATEEANNLVMQRAAPVLPKAAQEFIDPEIPITTQVPAAERTPAQALETPASVTTQPTRTAPALSSADKAFDQIATQQDAFQKSLEDDFKRREELANKRYGEVQAQLEKINANPVEIDNRSLWAKSNTGQKVVLALGALLSSMNPNSAKAFQDNIQNTIDNDLKLQMDALNNQRADKNSLLSQMQKITGDSDSAAAAYKSQIYGVIANKLQLQAQKAQSQIQREQAMMNYNLAVEQRDIERQKVLSTLMQKQEEGAIPGFRGQVKDPVAAREFRAKIADKAAVEGEINNLLEINKQFLGGALSPSASASAKQSQNLLIGKLREAIVGPGTLSETDRGLLEDAIANPTDFFSLKSSNKIKLEKLKNSYNNALKSHAKALGLEDTTVPKSFKGI